MSSREWLEKTTPDRSSPFCLPLSRGPKITIDLAKVGSLLDGLREVDASEWLIALGRTS